MSRKGKASRWGFGEGKKKRQPMTFKGKWRDKIRSIDSLDKGLDDLFKSKGFKTDKRIM